MSARTRARTGHSVGRGRHEVVAKRAYYDPGTCRAAYWALILGVMSWPLFVVTAFGRRFRLMDDLTSFVLMGITFITAMLAMVIAILAFQSIWRHGTRGIRRAIEGFLMGLSVALFPIFGALAVLFYPTLNDVSTDLAVPPLLTSAQTSRVAPMNPVEPISEAQKAAQRAAYPNLVGKVWQFEMETVLRAVEAEIAQRDWSLATRFRSDFGTPMVQLEVVSRSLVFAFEDDVAIRLQDLGDVGIKVDMRSASRWGRHDLGANARHIEVFLDDVELRLQGSPRESIIRFLFGNAVPSSRQRAVDPIAPDIPSNVPRPNPNRAKQE